MRRVSYLYRCKNPVLHTRHISSVVNRNADIFANSPGCASNCTTRNIHCVSSTSWEKIKIGQVFCHMFHLVKISYVIIYYVVDGSTQKLLLRRAKNCLEVSVYLSEWPQISHNASSATPSGFHQLFVKRNGVMVLPYGIILVSRVSNLYLCANPVLHIRHISSSDNCSSTDDARTRRTANLHFSCNIVSTIGYFICDANFQFWRSIDAVPLDIIA